MSDEVVENEEKGFDDSELEDIMSEIEELENGFDDGQDDDVTSDVKDNNEPVAQSDEEQSQQDEAFSAIEDAVEDSGKKDSENSHLAIDPADLSIDKVEVHKTDLQKEIDDELSQLKEQTNAKASDGTGPSDVLPFETTSNINPQKPTFEEKIEKVGGHSKMDLSVSGDMTLQLNFNIGGQNIQLYINEGDGFVIEMDGGVKFSIPVKNEKIDKAS